MKTFYREYFASMKGYVKFKPFLKSCNILDSNFSMFMKGSAYDCFMSIDNLEKLKTSISEFFLNIV